MITMTKRQQTEFARLVQARLREQGKSQREATANSDISHVQLGRVLKRDEEQLLHTELFTLVAVARALNIDLITLLETFIPEDVLRGDRDSVARSISMLPQEKQQIISQLIRSLALSQDKGSSSDNR